MREQKKYDTMSTKIIYDYIFLAEFLEILRPKNSLEIGIHRGLTFRLLHKYSTHALGLEIDHRKKVAYAYPPQWNIVYKDSFLINCDDLGADTIFDFIHIDGNHQYKAVVNDLEKCLPHIGSSTIICMDDYARDGVVNGINSFLRSNKDFFIKSLGLDQAFLVTKKSEIIFDNTVAKFRKEIIKLLKLQTILKTFATGVDSNGLKILEKLSTNKKFNYLHDTLQGYFALKGERNEQL